MKRLACLVVAFVLCAVGARADIIFSDDWIGGGEAQTAPAGQEAPGETVMILGEGTPDADEPALPEQTGQDEGWPRQIVITVGGDCTLGCTDSQRGRETGFASVIRENGYAWPFSKLIDVFGQDDLTLVNFEGTLTESDDKVEKKFNFKGPAEYAQMLVLGSVEAVTLANNHYGDYGEQGETDTRAALDSYGITYCAKGQTAIYETRGVKIGLVGNTFAYTDGKCDISKDVQALREEGCQLVVASFHWGSEYSYDFSRDQRNIGRAAIDSGADVVVGHHPHVVQGIEGYEGTYILYSLGNLVFGGNTNPDDRDTYIAQLTFTVYEDGSADGPQLQIYPMRLTSLADGTDYRPVFAVDSHERILQKILSRSRNMEGFVNPQ